MLWDSSYSTGSSHRGIMSCCRLVSCLVLPVTWLPGPVPFSPYLGRHLAESRRTFETFSNRRPYPVQQIQPQYPTIPTRYSSSVGPATLRTGFDLHSSSGGRPLLPKTNPSTPSESVPYPQSPLEQPSTRKRGRPPKEEVNRRKAEAEARGEVYPAPRSKRAKRPSQAQELSQQQMALTPHRSPVPGPSQPTLSTPTGAGAAPTETGSESSGSKRRRLQRPADIETTGVRSQRNVATSSYESPPQTSITPGQPSASTTSGAQDMDTRMEIVEETVPTSRAQSFRDIVGIKRSTSSG